MNICRTLRSGAFLLLLCVLCSCGAAQTSRVPLPTSRVHEKPTPTPTPLPSPTPLSLFAPTPTVVPLVGEPARLLIPSIGVNASVEGVGITSDGNLDTPRQNPWVNVGWFNAGRRPGEVGSAVIDGHVSRTGGAPAVFWQLGNLRVGAYLSVLDTNNQTLRFQVTRVAAYAPDKAPLQEIFNATGGTFLNLITCAGDWVPSQHQMSLRLVIYAAKV